MKLVIIFGVLSTFGSSVFANDLIGKKLKYIYTNGNEYELCFLSKSDLHWKSVKGEELGASANEKYTYSSIKKQIYHIGWVEKSGFAVSQIIDLNAMTVNAHLIYKKKKEENPVLEPAVGTIKVLKSKKCKI